MPDTKAKVSVDAEAMKEFVDNFPKLSEKNQIYVLGMIKGITIADDPELQKKGA